MTFHLDVLPGTVRINGRYTLSRGRMILSREYRSGVDSMALQIRQAMVRAGWTTLTEPCGVVVRTYWATAKGDCDSVIKAVLDALEHGRAIVNDAQVRTVIAHKTVDKLRPRIEVTVAMQVEP
jgi:Holliday junction resolvase RusA-like endonuclease